MDWHSAVHGHWTLARAAALYPDSSLAQNVTSFFNKQFTEENVEKELKFLQFPGKSSFERTYGWAWLLKLQVKYLGLYQQNHNLLISGGVREVLLGDRQ